MKAIIALAAMAVLASCATSTTTQLAQNTVRIDVSTAPACGRQGAIRLVNRMAAVETLRHGYDRFVISDSQAQDNLRVVGYNFNTYGYGGLNATPIVGGTRDAAVIVVMFKEGDPQGQNAIDARQALGPDWQAIVAEGAPQTCS
jgi:hypothetical protein